MYLADSRLVHLSQPEICAVARLCILLAVGVQTVVSFWYLFIFLRVDHTSALNVGDVFYRIMYAYHFKLSVTKGVITIELASLELIFLYATVGLN
jgi:hypothetical protein